MNKLLLEMCAVGQEILVAPQREAAVTFMGIDQDSCSAGHKIVRV